MLPIERFNKDSAIIKAANDYRDRKNISVFGVQQYAKLLLTKEGGGGLVLCADISTGRNYARSLASMGEKAVFLPPKDDELLYSVDKSGMNIAERLTVFCQALTGKVDYVVTVPSSLLCLYPDKEQFLSHIITLEKGKDYDLSTVISRLLESGYKREEQITDMGKFSLRGDILDVFPLNSPTAYRIEFFGDTVDIIKELDVLTQLSSNETDSVEIVPFAEIFEFPKDVLSKLNDGFYKKLLPDDKVRSEDLISTVASSVESGCIEYGQNWLLPYCKHCNIYEFFGFDRFIVDDCKPCFDTLISSENEHNNRYDELYRKGEVTALHSQSFYKKELVMPASDMACLGFLQLTTANRFFLSKAVHKVYSQPLGNYTRDFRVLALDLQTWLAKGYVIDFRVSGSTAEILKEFLRNNGFASNRQISISDALDENGCIFDKDKLVFVCNYDLSVKAKQKSVSRSKKDVFTVPEVGDYIVHDHYGIGLYNGVKTIEIGGAVRDYLEIEYAGGDKLFVPIENMDNLSRYISTGGTPKLSKMGNGEFERLKAKAKESIKKLAVDLMALYSERQQNKGYIYSDDDSLLHDFENKFPFAETDDQITAVKECLKDLKSGKIMDRLLCGDVGYGKTEVALRVAFKVISEGKQVAFLAPTTILAKQHFDTVKKRMEEYGIKAVRLTRFDSTKEVNNSIAMLKNGTADIAVGTHKMLSKNVGFKDLGLLILDEEQRFGVGDKEKLKDVKRNVNVLTLSATPIPRTLHMSMVGIRDISILDQPPFNRIPVQTFVVEYSETLLVDAINREMGRGGQTFVVYNRVANIDEFCAKLQSLMPDVKFVVGHGQMDEKVLEERIDAFVEGKYDVLISSTIVENGIDIPRANTMFVIDADKMGLSQLYQLKGRVGRSDRMAYAYFTYDERKSMGENAYKRLQALAAYTDFGSGFKIAMRDMEIRGAGNILGAEQHGHMEKVGYDMYCKLMKETMAEQCGKTIDSKRDVKMIVDYDTFIPESFVSDAEWRYRMYNKIAEISSVEEREKVLGEIIDAYGKPPESVYNLISVALMKNLAARIKAYSVMVRKDIRKVTFNQVMDIDNRVHAEALKEDGTLVLDEKPYIKFRNNNSLMKFLLNCNKIL